MVLQCGIQLFFLCFVPSVFPTHTLRHKHTHTHKSETCKMTCLITYKHTADCFTVNIQINKSESWGGHRWIKGKLKVCVCSVKDEWVNKDKVWWVNRMRWSEWRMESDVDTRCARNSLSYFFDTTKMALFSFLSSFSHIWFLICVNIKVDTRKSSCAMRALTSYVHYSPLMAVHKKQL